MLEVEIARQHLQNGGSHSETHRPSVSVIASPGVNGPVRFGQLVQVDHTASPDPRDPSDQPRHVQRLHEDMHDDHVARLSQ